MDRPAEQEQNVTYCGRKHEVGPIVGDKALCVRTLQHLEQSVVVTSYIQQAFIKYVSPVVVSSLPVNLGVELYRQAY